MAKSCEMPSPHLANTENVTPLNCVMVGLQLGVPLVQPTTVEFHAATWAIRVNARGLLAAGPVAAFAFCRPILAVRVPATSITIRRVAVFKGGIPCSYQDKSFAPARQRVTVRSKMLL